MTAPTHPTSPSLPSSSSKATPATSLVGVVSAVKPRVLENHQQVDSAGNVGQFVRLLYICGHTDEFFSLRLGKGWKPRTNAQLVADHLRMTCPIAWRVCPSCADPTRYVPTGKQP